MAGVELKAVVPKSQYNDKRLNALIRKAVQKSTRKTKGAYEKTVKSWTKKPKFSQKTSVKGGNLAVRVFTTSAIYGYVDRGTHPHPISAVNVPLLKFQNQYRPKTVPGVIGSSNSPGKTGDWVSKRQVNHPGNEARRFTKIIAKQTQKELQTNVSQAMGQWVKESLTAPTKR